MFHAQALDTSFAHRHKLNLLFKDVLGIEEIDHISINLVNPRDEMLFFSSTPQHAYEICKRGLGEYDGIISPEYYKNFEFYWWKEAAHKKYANEIANIREGVLGFKHGFMLVRKIDNFYLLYSFATKKNIPQFHSVITNRLNEFLKIGDYVYSELREVYVDYCGNMTPPIIERFYPFEGGKPPERHSKNSSSLILPWKKTAPPNVIAISSAQKKRKCILEVI